MRIALLVEGPSDEQTIPYLIHKILGDQISIICRVLRGRWNLLNSQKVYSIIINDILKEHSDISKIIVCVDLECARDSGTEKSERTGIRNVERSVRRLMKGREALPIFYIPVTYALEGWLLADSNAIRKYLGSRARVKIPDSATLDCRPKEVMRNLFRKAGRKFIPRQDYPRIARSANVNKILKRNESFRALQEKIIDP